MKIDILTLFPKMFTGPFDESIVQRAQDKKLVEIKIHDLRKWTSDKHKTVDDKPFGGGTGMIMMIEPIYKALNELKSQTLNSKQSTINNQQLTILLSPRGQPFNQKTAQRLAKYRHLIFLCGHYEGVDERVSEHLVDEEISIGDYVLTGGELPAMVLIDSITRLIPGVLKKSEATKEESFSNFQLPTSNFQTLEFPQYTRPETFQGWPVPPILLSGHHKKIKEWRLKKSLEKTKKLRPDLL